MEEASAFKDQKRLRKAEFIAPPNVLKQKIGSGGLDNSVLVKAQTALEDNTIDFKPIAARLLNALEEAIRNAGNNPAQGEAAIEAMLYPAAQLKAQGSMFHFPLVSELSEVLVSFLETITTPPSAEVLEIVSAHKMAISAVLNMNIADVNDPRGKELKSSLMDACTRYYKSRKVQ